MSDPEAPQATYLWFDAEFSGLDLDNAVFLQVACMATDANLQRLAAPETDVNCYLRIPPDTPISPWVEEHLQTVLAHCRGEDAIEGSELEPRLLTYLDDVLGADEREMAARPVLAGNSVHNDWFLARRTLTYFTARCHYRLLDVSAFKQQWSGWLEHPAFDKDNEAAVREYFPGLVHEAGAMQQHDAYYDIQASVAELAYYRKHLLTQR